MGVTDPDADTYHRQSMILVPMDAPGVTVVRGLPVFGHSEGGGHGETLWENVRVPEGEPPRRGGQRLRDRAGPPRPRSHPPLHARHRHGRTRARPDVHARADARRVRASRSPTRVSCASASPSRGCRSNRSRLLTMKAAWMMDTVGKKARATEIAAIKVIAARVRDRRDRPRDPAVRRRGRHRRLAARGDVRARAHAAPRRRSRRGAHAPDRAPRARQVRAPPPDGLLSVKVRVGYGLGNLRPLDGERLGALAEALEQHGFDSLWLSERISGPAPDPVLGLTFAAARTQKIKLGTSVLVLPGPEPGARREGVGDARRRSRAGARSRRSGSASRTRSSSRRSASSAATAPRSSTRRCRSSAACGPRTPSTTTARGSTTRA